jgi:calcineurin-like phosphoesterase
MDAEEPLSRFLTKIPRTRYEPAMGEATLCGLAIDIDDATGLARRIAPFRRGPHLDPVEPDFW